MGVFGEGGFIWLLSSTFNAELAKTVFKAHFWKICWNFWEIFGKILIFDFLAAPSVKNLLKYGCFWGGGDLFDFLAAPSVRNLLKYGCLKLIFGNFGDFGYFWKILENLSKFLKNFKILKFFGNFLEIFENFEFFLNIMGNFGDFWKFWKVLSHQIFKYFVVDLFDFLAAPSGRNLLKYGVWGEGGDLFDFLAAP